MEAGATPVLVHNCPEVPGSSTGSTPDYSAGNWNASTKLPSGGTIGQVGRNIWGSGLPSATRFADMTPEQIRGLASLEDAEVLNQIYSDAADAIPSNKTAPIRVQLTQQIIDAWAEADD